MELLSKTINKLTIAEKNDLDSIKKFILENNLSENRTSRHHEIYTLCLFVIAMHKQAKLNYPCHITKRESPDFSIQMGKESIGLEHTIATLESFQIAETEWEKYPKNSVIELSHYLIDNEPYKKNSDIGIKLSTDKLTGDPIFGEKDVKEWVAIVISQLVKKNTHFKDKNYEIFPSNELIIETQIPHKISKKHRIATTLLKETISKTNRISKLHFDKIHIFSQNDIIYDLMGSCEIVQLRKNNLL